MGHADAPGQAFQGGLANRVEHDLGVIVVGLGDHRGEEVSIVGGEIPVACPGLVQVATISIALTTLADHSSWSGR
jgi:hypothetical protein